MAGKSLILCGEFDMILLETITILFGKQNNISKICEPGKFALKGGVVGEYEQFIVFTEKIQLEPSLKDWHRAQEAPAV